MHQHNASSVLKQKPYDGGVPAVLLAWIGQTDLDCARRQPARTWPHRQRRRGALLRRAGAPVELHPGAEPRVSRPAGGDGCASRPICGPKPSTIRPTTEPSTLPRFGRWTTRARRSARTPTSPSTSAPARQPCRRSGCCSPRRATPRSSSSRMRRPGCEPSSCRSTSRPSTCRRSCAKPTASWPG